MRILKRCCLTLVLLGWLTACGGAQPPAPEAAPPVSYQASAEPGAEFVAYSDPEYGFTIQLPRSWFSGELSGETYGILATNTNEADRPRAAISVVVEPVGGAVDVAAAATAAEETLLASPEIADFKRDLARPATVNGAAGEERQYRYTSAGQSIRQRTVYVPGADVLYAISLIAPQGIFAQHEALFEGVLTSFKGA